MEFNFIGMAAYLFYLAIWDNRCAFHSATFDYEGNGERAGVSVAGAGEVPYFDPNSKSRTESLAQKV